MRRIRWFDLLNPGIMFFWMYMLFLCIGALFIPRELLYSLKINVTTIRLTILYIVIFMISSHIIANLVLDRRPKLIVCVKEYDIGKSDVFKVSMVFYIVGILGFLFVYWRIGFIPILQENAENVRVEAKNGLGSYILLSTGMLYVVNLFLYGYYNQYCRVRKILINFIGISSILTIMGIGYRSPAIVVLLIAIFSKYFVSNEYNKKKRIPKKYMLYGIIIMVILTVIGVLRKGEVLTIRSLLSVFWLMTVNLMNFDNIINYYSSHDFMYGSTIVNDILASIPGVNLDFFSNKFKKLIGATFRGEGITITAPGEGYANGGIIGVFLHALILGIVVGLVYEVLSRKNRITDRLLLVVLTINIWRIVSGGIVSMITFSLVPTLICYYLFLIIVKKTEGRDIRKI